MYLTVKQQVKHLSKDEYLTIKELCHVAKNLTNEAIYNVRQYYFTEGEFLKYKNNGKGPKFLMIGSNGSDSGKTFILTGLAGALRKRGLKVALMKVGPDARDIVPGLYLTNGKMEDYGSIKIGHLGWMDIKLAIDKLNKSDYDIVLIEGVMSVFTGLLNEKVPYSASEIAIIGNQRQLIW